MEIRTDKMTIRHLFLSPGHNFFGRHGQLPGENPLIEMPQIRCLAGRWIEGDRFFDFKDNYKGQITFFSSEVWDELSISLRVRGNSPGAARRNVVTAGVDLNSLIGQGFEVQGVQFAGVAECSPCYWMDLAIAPGAETFLAGRGGLLARILTDGILSANS